MESKLEGKVNYLQFIDWIHNTAKQNEELQDRLLHRQEEDQYTKMVTNDDKQQ